MWGLRSRRKAFNHERAPEASVRVDARALSLGAAQHKADKDRHDEPLERGEESGEGAVIANPDAIPDERAVVIKSQHAVIAAVAVRRAGRSPDLACVTPLELKTTLLVPDLPSDHGGIRGVRWAARQDSWVRE